MKSSLKDGSIYSEWSAKHKDDKTLYYINAK